MISKLCTLFAVLSIAAAPAAPVDSGGSYHFTLARSSPEADARVSAPEEVRLWFSQVPQDGSVSVRLLDGEDELVETGDPEADESDGRVWSLVIGHTLPTGSYTVAWRGIGDDGHVVRGSFGFSVTATSAAP